mmetsp:Transcript_11104/g.21752  ORF Transcript_11104/g.21752 Transcript_11104/m.21752 type:complete len:201 (-) Transcript_11104:715-1317(-)
MIERSVIGLLISGSPVINNEAELGITAGFFFGSLGLSVILREEFFLMMGTVVVLRLSDFFPIVSLELFLDTVSWDSNITPTACFIRLLFKWSAIVILAAGLNLLFERSSSSPRSSCAHLSRYSASFAREALSFCLHVLSWFFVVLAVSWTSSYFLTKALLAAFNFSILLMAVGKSVIPPSSVSFFIISSNLYSWLAAWDS